MVGDDQTWMDRMNFQSKKAERADSDSGQASRQTLVKKFFVLELEYTERSDSPIFTVLFLTVGTGK